MTLAGEVPSQRVDQWLWFARIAKSRTLAQALITRGKVRLNRERIERPSQMVKSGDVITISLGPRVRVLQINGCGLRRGPAPEAARLYLELTPKPDAPKSGSAAAGEASVATVARPPERERGTGRPTKRDRRAIDRLKGRSA